MKGLSQFVTEARYQEPTTLYFQTTSAADLFKYEIEGQISDGHWENSRPDSHWKWLQDCTVVVDPNHEPGYVGPKHRIKYDCKWLLDDLNKWLKSHDEDYEWTTRFLNYGKAGKIISDSQFETFSEYAYKSIIGDLPQEEVTAKELEASLPDYKKKYWDEVKGDINDTFLKKFYKTSYTVRDLKVDIMDLNDTLNTQLTES